MEGKDSIPTIGDEMKGAIPCRLSEFEKVKTEYCEYKAKIKIIKPNGETNWMDISEKELVAIRNFLCGGG